MYRCTEALVDFGEERWQKTVAAHAQEYTALSEQGDHDYRAVSKQNSQDDGLVQPWISGLYDTCGIRMPHLFNGYSYRSNAHLSTEIGVMGYSCHDMGKENI